MADGYQFNLALLTSFDARSPGGGVLSSDEGVQTFRQMVIDGLVGSSSVVRVKLRYESNTVVITDSASGDELEHIPFTLISQISQVINDRSCSPFDNILIFTVLEDEFQMAPPEMYFFQCLDAPVCFVCFISVNYFTIHEFLHFSFFTVLYYVYYDVVVEVQKKVKKSVVKINTRIIILASPSINCLLWQ